MTPWQVPLGIAAGFVAGVLSGLFGVGGGVVTTPAVNVLLGGTAYQAIGTPLPVIFPTSLVGAYTYSKAGEVGLRAAWWTAIPGAPGAYLGASLSAYVNPHLLLITTSILMAWTAVRVMRGRRTPSEWRLGATPGWKYAVIGLAAGFISGILGVGGGIVMVPAFTILIGMPIKRALGTSLVVISVLVVPATLRHWALGHIDWAIFLVLAIGVVPGARLGSKLALGASERTLRVAVGLFLLAIAVLYGIDELVALVQSRG